MTRPRSIWRAAARILLAYQALIAAAVMAFGVWIGSAAAACQPDCGVVGAFFGLLGFVWVTQALLAGAAVVVLFVLTTIWASRGAAVATIVVEGLLFLPATRFLEIMGPFGFPGPGLYALGVAIGAAVILVALSGLELFASDGWLRSRRSIAVAFLVAIPFGAAAVPGLATAASSAQLGSDGFPVGPVSAQFVQDRGSKLPLAYPGSRVTYTRATAESKNLDRIRMASWEERLTNNGLKADVEGWYQTSLTNAGWRRVVCRPGGCQDDFVLVFVHGSRECVSVLVTSDGAGQIVIDYQITPSGRPLAGDPTANHRYCTGQY